MKNKGAVILIALTAAFVVFIAGYMLGTHTNPSVNATENTFANLSKNETTGKINSAYIDGLLNINAATAEDLKDLPGIGDMLANNILSYREAYGSFKSVDDLINVKGIGKAKLESIRDYITVSGG